MKTYNCKCHVCGLVFNYQAEFMSGTTDCAGRILRSCGRHSGDEIRAAFNSGVVPDDKDPFQSAEYQKFVESLVPECQCLPESVRPCDGLLAGGPCDNIQGEPDWSEGHDCPAGDIREDDEF